jgi:5-methylcytosine-specific restriction protein A
MKVERLSSQERGYTSRWAAYSRRYRKQHPLCVDCKNRGIIKLANHVDHIKPVSGPDDPLFWDGDNHQALCTPCHSRKTAREDGGFGNTKSNKPVGDCGIDGVPVDPRHPWSKG